jgi:hypothetical protein
MTEGKDSKKKTSAKKQSEWGGNSGERITCWRNGRCCPVSEILEYAMAYKDGIWRHA